MHPSFSENIIWEEANELYKHCYICNFREYMKILSIFPVDTKILQDFINPGYYWTILVTKRIAFAKWKWDIISNRMKWSDQGSVGKWKKKKIVAATSSSSSRSDGEGRTQMLHKHTGTSTYHS